MKMLQLREKSKTDLADMLNERRVRLQELRFQLLGGKVKNIKELRSVKKDISRILMLLSHTNA